jgi:hypothetical protein
MMSYTILGGVNLVLDFESSLEEVNKGNIGLK